uniref:(northern house mosquito) hypothetical protein n=1 Tax=Culex pipiens TaxID=7175 RepID=A0A8D8P7E4_CULPI
MRASPNTSRRNIWRSMKTSLTAITNRMIHRKRVSPERAVEGEEEPSRPVRQGVTKSPRRRRFAPSAGRWSTTSSAIWSSTRRCGRISASTARRTSPRGISCNHTSTVST